MTSLKSQKYIPFLILSGILLSQAFQNCGGYRATELSKSSLTDLSSNESENPSGNNTSGTIDTTFGTNGVFDMSSAEYSSSISMSKDLQNRTYFFGQSSVLRLKADMSVDRTFGNQGTLVVGENMLSPASIQPDDKLILGSQDRTAGTLSFRRYLPSGAPDSSFTPTTPISFPNSSYFPSGLNFFSNGKFLLHLFSTTENAVPYFYIIDRNGQRDLSFVLPVTRDIFGPQWATGSILSTTIQTDDKIVVAYKLVDNTGWAVGIIRLNANGTRDMTFGSNGVPISLNLMPWSMTPGPSAKLLFTGLQNTSQFVATFNANGQPDTSFGTNGVSLTQTQGTSFAYQAYRTLTSLKGKMVLITEDSVYGIDHSGKRVLPFGRNGFLTYKELGFTKNFTSGVVSFVFDELLQVCRSAGDDIRCVRIHL